MPNSSKRVNLYTPEPEVVLYFTTVVVLELSVAIFLLRGKQAYLSSFCSVLPLLQQFISLAWNVEFLVTFDLHVENSWELLKVLSQVFVCVFSAYLIAVVIQKSTEHANHDI